MREKILDSAERMVQDRGLNAMSFQALANAVGLSKPTVFHHFRNKEALALALVERCQQKYGILYGEVIQRDSRAPEKLREIASVFERGLVDDRLCLLAALGNSVSTLPGAVQDDLRLTAALAIDRFTRVFEQGQAEQSLAFVDDPQHAAAAFLALLQGLQILARAKRDRALFRRSIETYIAAITQGREGVRPQ